MNFFARYFTSEVSWIFSLNDIYVDMIYATLSFYCNTGLYWLPKYDVDNETDYFFGVIRSPTSSSASTS